MYNLQNPRTSSDKLNMCWACAFKLDSNQLIGSRLRDLTELPWVSVSAMKSSSICNLILLHPNTFCPFQLISNLAPTDSQWIERSEEPCPYVYHSSCDWPRLDLSLIIPGIRGKHLGFFSRKRKKRNTDTVWTLYFFLNSVTLLIKTR